MLPFDPQMDPSLLDALPPESATGLAALLASLYPMANPGGGGAGAATDLMGPPAPIPLPAGGAPPAAGGGGFVGPPAPPDSTYPSQAGFVGPPAPATMSASDLLPPPGPSPDLPLPPSYALAGGDLPPELQQRLQQQQLAGMGMAFGQAKPGGFGEALARASGVPGAATDQAVAEYRKYQDQTYQRDLVRSEFEAKMAQQSAGEQRQQMQARQLSDTFNTLAHQLPPDSPTLALAKTYAQGGDAAKLAALASQVTTIRQLGGSPDDPDFLAHHQQQLKTEGEAASLTALLPIKAATAGAEAAARLPAEQAIKQYGEGLITARERNMALFNSDLKTQQERTAATISLGREMALADYNRQQSASQPLTQTEAAKLAQQQAMDQYRATLLDQKGTVSVGGKDVLPSQLLQQIQAQMKSSGPMLPPGVGIRQPPVPPASPQSPFLPQLASPAGAPLAPGGGTGAHQPPGAPAPPKVGDGDAAKIKDALSKSGEAQTRKNLAAAGYSAAQVDQLILAGKGP